MPDLIHGRVYASYAESGLTAPVNAMLTSIRKTLDSADYLRIDKSD
jgi:hypothetical protein